jgi:hypothetical protein
MTITRIERLVRRVRGSLEGSEAGGAQVAAEFAEVCREANRRLEEALGSLRRGDLGGALDLSEADPPLAEQFRVLAFGELPAWVQRCREAGWPVPETPDLRGFQSLQRACQDARGKEVDPALVESFRAAMVAGDRPAALRVLATVLRRRPGDAWAAGERGKLLVKESEASLRRLEAMLASDDGASLAAEFDKFEQLGLDAKHRPDVYEAARLRRQDLRREEAQAKVRLWLQEADELRRSGDWRGVEARLETAAMELEEGGAGTPPGHLWTELHQWSRLQRTELEQREQLRQREEQVTRELEALEGLRRDGTSRSASRLRESLAQVEKFLAFPGGGGVMWPEPVHRRLRQEGELLAADLRRKRTRTQVLIAAVVVAGLAVAAGLFQWKQEEIQQEFFLREIDRMISERKVDEAEAWLESEEAKRAGGRARGAAELAKLRSFLDKERAMQKSAEEELARLEKMSSDRGQNLTLRWQAWEEFEKRLASVHPQWRSRLAEDKERALVGLRGESREATEKRARMLRELIRRVEGEFSDWEKAKQSRREDIPRLQGMLDSLADGAAWRQETVAALAMPADLEKEFTAQLAAIADVQTSLDDFLKAREALEQAAGVAEYRSALERLAGNPRLGPAEKEKAQQVLSAWQVQTDVLGALWLPWVKPLPEGLSGGKARFMPARLEGTEENLLREIGEDDFLHDIWAYQVPVATDSKGTYRLYARGRLKEIPGSGSQSPYTYGQGEIFIPKDCAKDEPVVFEKRPRSQSFMGIRQDSEKLLIGFSGRVEFGLEGNAERLRPIRENLEKALSADPGPALTRAPIPEAIEKLLPNQADISPLARAYLAQRVWKLATVAQDPTRFGLVFSPSLLTATASWTGWGLVEPGVWLKRDILGTDRDWVNAFSVDMEVRFADEAKLMANLWSRAGQAGLAFGGWVDEQGQPRNLDRLANLEAGQLLLGQGRKGELVTGWRYEGGKWKPGSEVRSFSPLYLLPRSPEALFQEALRAGRLSEEWARPWLRQTLPLLFPGSS